MISEHIAWFKTPIMTRFVACMFMMITTMTLGFQARILLASRDSDGNKFTTMMKFSISAQSGTKFVALSVLIPRSTPRQRILSIRYTLQPNKVVEREGSMYAQFVIDRSKPAEFAIYIDAEIFQSDLSTVMSDEKGREFCKKEDLKKWLAHEPWLEKDAPEIQAVAKRLAGSDEQDTIGNCFNFVLKTLHERPYDDKDYGAVWALGNRQGDCTEYSDLFVTLCRANGIPARTCEGYLLEPAKYTQKHNWAEVYMEKYGWVSFDPFYTSFGRASFAEMRPVYLLLDNQRRNAGLDNHHLWAYRYSGTGPVQVRDEFQARAYE